MTDQSPGTGTSFTYTLDDVGRLSEINSTSLGATAPLLSNAQYRASGALKHRDSGNGTGINIAYNSRGLMTQYSLSGVKQANGAARPEGSDFQYYANGEVKFASDHYGRSFYPMSFHDKSYQYDHAGRLQIALSGVQANDFLNGTNSGPFISAPPYLQTSTHDAWDNLVERQGRYWGEDDIIEPQTYDAHNRNYAWSYDADGRLLSMNEPPYNVFPYAAAAHTYDAAGGHVKNTQTTSRQRFDLPGDPVWTTVTTIAADNDGDGQQIKRVETTENVGHWTDSDASYYLRSSVLGQVITEYNVNGTRRKSYVYPPNPFGEFGEVISTSTLEPAQAVYWLANPIPPPQNTQRQPQITPCDQKFANIFGGDGAVARTEYEFNGAYRGRDPALAAALDSRRWNAPSRILPFQFLRLPTRGLPKSASMDSC